VKLNAANCLTSAEPVSLSPGGETQKKKTERFEPILIGLKADVLIRLCARSFMCESARGRLLDLLNVPGDAQLHYTFYSRQAAHTDTNFPAHLFQSDRVYLPLPPPLLLANGAREKGRGTFSPATHSINPELLI
jgi:hypothetical protein